MQLRACLSSRILPAFYVFRWGYLNTDKAPYCFDKIVLPNARESKKPQPCLHTLNLTSLLTNGSAIPPQLFHKSALFNSGFKWIPFWSSDYLSTIYHLRLNSYRSTPQAQDSNLTAWAIYSSGKQELIVTQGSTTSFQIHGRYYIFFYRIHIRKSLETNRRGDE